MRKKKKAGLLSLFFGSFGVHKFYLGETGKGILFAMISFFSIKSGGNFFSIMVFVGIVQAILLFVMDNDLFDRKYNGGRNSRREERTEGRRRTRRQRTNTPKKRFTSKVDKQKAKDIAKSKQLISEGVKLFKDYDYAAALEQFVAAERLNPRSPSVNFNLAVTYSLMEDREKAFIYLDKAVKLGFKDFEKINTHDGLAYLRTSLDFDEFKMNNYRLKVSPDNLDDTMSEPEQLETRKLLEQLQMLADMRRKGDITHGEFLLRKKELVEKK